MKKVPDPKNPLNPFERVRAGAGGHGWEFGRLQLRRQG